MTFRHHQAAVQRRSSVEARRESLSSNQHRDAKSISESANHLPLPATSPGGAGEKSEKVEFLDLPPPPRTSTSIPSANGHGRRAKESLAEGDGFLLPARNPPRYSYFDLFPFSLLVKFLTKRGKQVKGKKGARLRARLQHHSVTHNLPLELSLYLVCFSSRCRCLCCVGFLNDPQSSYIAALQKRNAIDSTTLCECYLWKMLNETTSHVT